MVNFGQIIVGLILILVVTGGLLFIFYSRTNAVQKNGYGSVAMLSLVSLLIPVFWILIGSANTANAQTQQINTIKRGMNLYAQYCTDQCYAIDKNRNNQVLFAKWNQYTFQDLNKLTDEEIKRIIAGGVYPDGKTPANPNAIVKSEEYGGQLSAMDVNDLLDFVRSSDPAYLQKQGYTGDAAVPSLKNFGTFVQTNYQTQFNNAVNLAVNGQFGAPVDMTKETSVAVGIVSTVPGQNCQPACFQYSNLQVKVGTTITWTNQDTNPHTVVAIQGSDISAHKAAPEMFETKSNLEKGQTFTWKVTPEAYSFNPDHTIIYYCSIHPDMVAKLTIVQ